MTEPTHTEDTTIDALAYASGVIDDHIENIAKELEYIASKVRAAKGGNPDHTAGRVTTEIMNGMANLGLGMLSTYTTAASKIALNEAQQRD